MKKFLLLTVSIGVFFTFVGVFMTSRTYAYTFDNLVNNYGQFRMSEVITGISYIIVCLSAMAIAVIIFKNLVVDEKYKSKAVKIAVSVITGTVAFYAIMLYIICTTFFAYTYLFGGREQTVKYEAMSDFYAEIIAESRGSDCISFQDAASFEWDTVYIMSHDFNADQLGEYVDGQTYDEFQYALRLINKIRDPEGESVLCFFNNEKLLITMDLGFNIYPSISGNETIYFSEISPEDAYFYSEEEGMDFNLFLCSESTP